MRWVNFWEASEMLKVEKMSSMNGPDSERSSDASLWKMVPLSNYLIPGYSPPEVVRKKWLAVKQWFRRGPDNAEQMHGKAEEELRALPILQLENLVPPIDWMPAVEAFDRALDGNFTMPSYRPGIRFLVGQPHGGHRRILEAWAKLHGGEVVVPPSYDEILSGGLAWIPEPSTVRHVWVLPALERCFLRHAAGLSSVRTFLERAVSGAVGYGVIGCDSWAWAFLQRIWPVADPQALTLQAFDGRRLADYFIRARSMSANRRVRFCNARSGADLMPEFQMENGGNVEIGAELRQLAAHCRGNLGVAWKYWRESLRGEPDSEQSESSKPDPASDTTNAGEEVVWMAPELKDPVLPAETEDEVAFILHALLLHNGLPFGLLPEVLLIPHARLLSYLLRLEAMGVVETYEEGWRVTALGYATAREFLRARDYLIDRF
jgi:hypothetical protein